MHDRLFTLKKFLTEKGFEKEAEMMRAIRNISGTGGGSTDIPDPETDPEAYAEFFGFDLEWVKKTLQDQKAAEEAAAAAGGEAEALQRAEEVARSEPLSAEPQAVSSPDLPPPVDQLASIRSGSSTLQVGSKDVAGNTPVSKIQSLLVKHGYISAGRYVNGNYGEETKNAVIQFQTNNQIEPTGIVDKNTLIMLESIAAVPAGQGAATPPGQGSGAMPPLPSDAMPPLPSDAMPPLPAPAGTAQASRATNIGSASSMETSEALMKEMADKESYRGNVYDDATGEPISSYGEAKGRATIGIGHLVRTREKPRFSKYLKGRGEMTRDQAWSLYKEDVKKHESPWKGQIKVPITQSMFDAMSSFAFNTGRGGPKKYNILGPLNEGDYMGAEKAIRNGPQTSTGSDGKRRKMRGLTKRRNREADRFLQDGIPYAGQTPGVDMPQQTSAFASIDNKFYNLNEYLMKNGFTQEASFLEEILKLATTNSDDQAGSTMSIGPGITTPVDPDATIPVQTRVERRRFPSEEVLKRNGVEIIKYIAGTEAERRGEGARTAEGNIYEVLHDGNRAIAKVVTSSNMEPDIWKKISEIEVPEEQRKHLPKIYKIVEDMFDTIIIMEVLEPFGGHMDSVLRTKRNRESGDLFKNEEFIHDAISRSFNSATETLRNTSKNEEEEDIYRSFVTEQEGIKRELERAILVRDVQTDGVSAFVNNKLLNISNLFMLGENDFISQIADEIQNNINSYFQASERPIPKYYSTEGVDQSIGALQGMLEDNPQGYSAGRNRRRLEALEKEREQTIYTESPEGFLFSEKYMPETESLFALLQTLKDNGINWSDVHANNLMQRPGSREPVIIDVGLYELHQ